MRQLIICAAVLFLSLGATAEYQSAAVDLTGSWKEVRRIARGGAQQSFTDTMYYDFMPGNEFASQQKDRYMNRGNYNATSSYIDLGAQAYKVLEMSHDRMLLKDNAGTYEFVRYVKPPSPLDK